MERRRKWEGLRCQGLNQKNRQMCSEGEGSDKRDGEKEKAERKRKENDKD